MRAPASDLPIVFEDASLRANDVAILDRVALALGPGEPTVLVGPNGAGKTSLIRLAASLAAALLAVQHGAKILRVHDVAATRDALARIERDCAAAFAVHVEHRLELRAGGHRAHHLGGGAKPEVAARLGHRKLDGPVAEHLQDQGAVELDVGMHQAHRRTHLAQQAAHFVAQGVIAGAYDIAIACGVESMTRAPMSSNARGGVGPFSGEFLAHTDNTLGIQFWVAQVLADKWGVTREEMDVRAAAFFKQFASQASHA